MGTLPVITADQWWSGHKRAKVLDGEMSYYDSDPGQASPRTAVFLHGNPTSSYLWRNVIPRVTGTARCLAPDLIGMGRSSKIPDIMYTYEEQYRYLSAWFDAISLKNKVTIICHDWGSGLGFNWVYNNQDRVEGLVYMEALVGVDDTLPNFVTSEDLCATLTAFRSDAGEEMILKNNTFVEKVLPRCTIRDFDPVEMEAYRGPFKEEGESRRPTLTWPREIPFRDVGPHNVVEIIDRYTEWLAESKDLPKLFIKANPGVLSPGIAARNKDYPNQKVVEVKGLHFIQEDSPIEIGDAVNNFMLSVAAE